MSIVLAVVGTDRHRFDRLIGWLEAWQEAWREASQALTTPAPRLILQYGYSRRPGLPEAVEFLSHTDLQAAMAEATLVISHGGPATITEARRAGHLPIVVPRDPAFDEHVDNHQQLFARRLAADGMIRLCETEAELTAALATGLADPTAFRWAADPTESRLRAEAVARVGQIVEDLITVPRQRDRRAAGRPRP